MKNIHACDSTKENLFLRISHVNSDSQAAAVQGNFYESVQNFRGTGKKRGRPYFALISVIY